MQAMRHNEAEAESTERVRSPAGHAASGAARVGDALWLQARVRDSPLDRRVDATDSRW